LSAENSGVSKTKALTETGSRGTAASCLILHLTQKICNDVKVSYKHSLT